MRVAFKVHGFVQGVGYRYYVKRIADKLKIAGYVQNLDDGSVLVVAEAEEAALREFEKLLYVSIKHGIQVLNIEKANEESAEKLTDFNVKD